MSRAASIDDPIAVADELVALLRGNEGFSTAANHLVATLGCRLGFEFTALWVPDARIGRLRCIAVWETTPGAFPTFVTRTREITIPPNGGVAGRAWASGVPVSTHDLAADDNEARGDAAAIDGLSGGLVLPVVAAHEVVGVIEMFGVRARELDPALQRSLVRICAELGLVLHRRLAAEASKLERARLELALDASGMGVWHWDFATNIITWSEAVQMILGRTGEFVGTVDDFSAVVHPSDRGRVLLAFQQALEPGGHDDLRLDYRVVTETGDIRWVESRGRPLSDDHGDLVAMTGVSADVTERKEDELDRETARARLDLALEAGRMGIWEWDVDRGEVTLSVTLQLEFGFPPRGTFEELSAFIHPDDRDAINAKIAGGIKRDGRFRTEARVIRPDGQVRWIANRGMAIRDASGRVVALTGVATDVTEERATQTRLRRKSQLLQTLNDVGRAVTSHLDLNRVVQMVTDAATTLTGAEFGAFFYNVPDGQGGHYLLYALSGAPIEAFDKFGAPRATAIFEPTFTGQAVVRLDDVTADPRYGQNPPHRGMPRGHLPVRSYLAVPVVGGNGEVYGGLFFGHPERGRFSENTERLATGIAAQAAIAIANARLFAESRQEIAARQRAYEERDAVARVLQASLLPPALPASADLAFGARYLPGTEMVGGDFYDVFPLGGRDFGVVVGDVCGKGPEAAAVTALARYTVRSAAVVEQEPPAVLTFLNDALLRDPIVDRFCSAAFARLRPLDGGGLLVTAAHAGHPPMAVLRSDGTLEVVHDTGMLLGVVPHPRVADFSRTLAVGDSVIFYTDGVTDARGPDGAFGRERLLDVAMGVADRPAQGIADAIIEAACQHGDCPQHDDMAVFVAQVLGT